MASPDTAHALADHPDWMPPRSDKRVFLGEPGAPEATKTTVEPGNAFSPGMLTFGVTWWLRVLANGRWTFFAPEEAPLAALRWRFADGFLPVLVCDAAVAGIAVRHTLFQDGTAADRSEAVAGEIALAVDAGDGPVEAQLFVALRSLGPAGGPVRELAVGDDRASLRLPGRGLTVLALDRSADAVGCGVGDPSPLARLGLVPEERGSADAAGWCFGLVRYDVSLAPGDEWRVRFDCPQQTYGNLEDDLPGTAAPAPDAFAVRRDAHLAAWRERLERVALDVPDRAFSDAFFAGLQHMLVATVEDQPRIAPLAYPLPWLRDSVFIVRCFDLAGLHDDARRLTEYCARNDFFGGFGAEGDAPGQGIWAIVQHFRVTGDRAWLQRMYPAVRRKAEWLFRMRRAERPIQVFVDTPTLAYTHAERTSGVVCVAAAEGVIRGSMDHGIEHSIGWINQWAVLGLREAAFAAETLGETADAVGFRAEADDLFAAVERYAARHPSYFAHDRTMNSLLWPTRAWEHDPDAIAPTFDAWWRDQRGTTEVFIPEPLWLYFEFAQAHNALLLGQTRQVWDVLDYRLRHQDVPGLYGWREGGNGEGTRNATRGVTLFHQLRGCQRFDDIAPHGWSQAEMWLLQRAVLVEEWQDGLLLFAGVPPSWLGPGARVAFRDFPTWYGHVSASLRVNERGDRVAVTAEGFDRDVPLTLRLNGSTTVVHSEGGRFERELDLAPSPAASAGDRAVVAASSDKDRDRG
jgi:hypothetical protein